MPNKNDLRNASAPTTNTSPRFGRRNFLKATGTGAMVAATAGCLGSGSNDGISIGALVPLPGEFPAGTGMKQAAEIAVKEINDNGGLQGEQVELSVKDTALDPSTARDKYRELILNEQIDATFGLFASEPGVAVFDEIPQHQKMHVAGGVAAMQVTERLKKDYDSHRYWFRAMYNGEQYGSNLGRLATEKWSDWGYNKIGVAVEDIEGFRGSIQPTALETMPDDIEVAFTEVFSPDTTDFTPMLDRGEQEDIDFLFSFLSQGGISLILQWAERKPNFMIGGADVFSGMPTQWKNTNGAVEHLWTYVGGSGPGFEWNQTTQDFIAAHEEAYGSPPPHAQSYTMYDAVWSWFNGVQQSGSFNADDIIPVMESDVEFKASTGTLNFHGKDHDYPHDPVYGNDGVMPPVIQWQEQDGEGKQVGLWPDQIKKGEYQQAPWIDN